MSGVRSGAVRKDVVRLFEGDSVAGMGEGELLHRFATDRDEAAFEALVTRLGPMVLGVARRMLADPHDVDDAFQATFLVLVKKAGAIRDVDLVAHWLYGVALKVARRARVESARRQAREQLASVPEGAKGTVEYGWSEIRAVIDEEIGRLPEAHRRAVVLCDVEGLSREEAAVRLGWTLNMVRGRLERARGRLRGRLARRGLAPSGAGMGLIVAPPSLSPSLLSSTVRAALAFSSGRLATGLASASAVALSRGVLKMMMISKLKLGAVALISAGFVAGGSDFIAAQGSGDKSGAEPAKAVAPAPEPARPTPPAADPFQPRSAAEVAKARVEVALLRLKTQQTFYDEGRITIVRLVDASQGLMLAELNAAGSKADRVAAARTHYDRIKEILKREKAELEVGRAPTADVAGAESALLEAEFTLAKELETPEAKPAVVGEAKVDPGPRITDRPSLNSQRVTLARRVYDAAARRFFGGEISTGDFLAASTALAKAEEEAAGTKAERVVAIRAQIDRLKPVAARMEEELKKGQVLEGDVDRIRLHLLDAESHLFDVSGKPGELIGPEPGGSDTAPNAGGRGKRKVEAGSPLAQAIAAFNAEASSRDHALAPDHDPLTENEVIANIRHWQPWGSGGIPTDSEIKAFKAIATTKRLPEGATFRLESGMLSAGTDFVYWGLRVSLMWPGQSGEDFPYFPIRTRLSRSLTLEEALTEAEEQARRRPDSIDDKVWVEALKKMIKPRNGEKENTSP